MDLIKRLGEHPRGIDGILLPSSHIDTLEQILQERFGKDAVLNRARRLRSRKNVVLHLTLAPELSAPIELVAKMFIVGKYDVEVSILHSSRQQGLTVPEIIEARDGVILMSFISGETLVDSINSTFDPNIIDKLAQWYYLYHSMHKQIKGDPRLRNFIYHGNTIYGVDFEESKVGPWMSDIAGAGASILDTNPIFHPRKRALSWRLLDTYLSLLGHERDAATEVEFTTVISDTLAQTSVWRKDRRILELSERIRTKGLPVD